MNEGKKLKISLWFVIITILFIIALIFTFIHISNSSKANTDEYVSNQVYQATASPERTSLVKIAKKEARDSSIDLNTLSEINSISNSSQGNTTNTSNTTTTSNTANTNTVDNTSSANNTTNNSAAENNTASNNSATQDEKNSYKLNNHTYKFDKTKKVSVENKASNQFLQLEADSYVMKMNTDTMYYNNLKKKSDLREFIQSNYKTTITSEIKSGNIGGMNIIVCTLEEDSKVGHLIITKLNENEIIYFKIFNKSDMSTLMSDLSEPIGEISSIISSSIK